MTESEDEECAGTSTSKMSSGSVVKIKRPVSGTSKSGNRNSKTGKAASSTATSSVKDNTHEDEQKSWRLRSKKESGSSSSDMTPSHATMMQPRNSESTSSDQQTSEKSSDKDAELSDCTPASNLKTMAQRKFASGSTLNTRHGCRTEKKLKKCGRTNADDKCEPISEKPLPRTKDFINYVCFRNTPFHFELEDGT